MLMLILMLTFTDDQLTKLLFLFCYMHIAKLGLLHILTAHVSHANVAVKKPILGHALETILLLASGALDFAVGFSNHPLTATAKVYILPLLQLAINVFVLGLEPL